MNHHRIMTVFLLVVVGYAQQPKALLIEAGRVLDVRSGAYMNHQGILVENERIKDLGDFASVRDRAPQDAVIINLGSATLLPGLIDSHAHLLSGIDFRLASDALTVAVTQ